MTDTPQPAPNPGSDITVRFAMGVAMIAVAVLVTMVGGWAFRILAFAAGPSTTEICGSPAADMRHGL